MNAVVSGCQKQMNIAAVAVAESFDYLSVIGVVIGIVHEQELVS